MSSNLSNEHTSLSLHLQGSVILSRGTGTERGQGATFRHGPGSLLLCFPPKALPPQSDRKLEPSPGKSSTESPGSSAEPQTLHLPRVGGPESNPWSVP